MRIKNLFFILLITVLFSGCISIDAPLASDKSFPSEGKYEIAGMVTHFAKKITVLGLFSWGGTGYMDLYEIARIRHRADDVVSVSVDVNIISVLGIVTVTEYTLRGTAIRYVKQPGPPPAE